MVVCVLLVLCCEFVPGNERRLKEHIRGLDLGGGIGSIIYQKKGSDYYYYHYNHKGDVVALTDGDRKLAAFYRYEAQGNTIGGSVQGIYKYFGGKDKVHYMTKHFAPGGHLDVKDIVNPDTCEKIIILGRRSRR